RSAVRHREPCAYSPKHPHERRALSCAAPRTPSAALCGRIAAEVSARGFGDRRSQRSRVWGPQKLALDATRPEAGPAQSRPAPTPRAPAPGPPPSDMTKGRGLSHPRPFESSGSTAAWGHLATAFFSAEPADTFTP